MGFSDFGPSAVNIWAATARSRGQVGAGIKTRKQANARVTTARNDFLANLREVVASRNAFAAFSAGLYLNADPELFSPFVDELPQRTLGLEG